MAVNGAGAGNVAAAAAAVGASVVYVSTDYVFDGAKGAPYVETDQPAPLSAYGRTKLAGEEATAAANKRHFIVRSAWLFGIGGGNFVETMLRLAVDPETRSWSSATRSARRPTPGTSPTGVVRLIEGIEYGIHHMAAAGAVLLVRVRPGDLRAGQGRVQGALGDDRDARPPGAAPALLGPDQPARARDPAALLAGRAGRLSRPTTSREGDSMKLLVTGAAGFIGSTYVRIVGDRARGRRPRQAHLRRAAREPARGRRAGRRRDRGPGDRARGDGGLRRRRQLRRRVPRRPLDRRPGRLRPHPRDRHRHVLLDAARELGVGRYLQVSTDEVYGSIESGSFTETSPLDPSSPYSATKAGGDLLVSAYFHTYGVEALICRGSNNYGPAPVPREADPADASSTPCTATRCRSTATACRSATGSTSRTSAAASTRC